MKKLYILGVIAIIGLLTACTSAAGSLSTVEYNNEVVETLNLTSSSIEDTTTTYDSSVPNIVTEEAEVDTDAMQAVYDEAYGFLTDAKAVLELSSKNASQEEAIKSEFINYLDLGEAYLATYSEMITYYSSGEFIENLDLVATYDEALHMGYNDFIDSNNSLVDVLAGFID